MPREVTLQLTGISELNPLSARLGREFFRSLPREPGVYLMRSAGGELLYVGKAKNLRNRLNSYKNARPSVVSRKIIRLLRLAHSIETRVCASEQEALLTENRLLREHRPPFNVLNTHPDTYYFIALKTLKEEEGRAFLRFQLTTDPGTPECAEAGSRLFGVFKGRGRTRDSFQALLRLVSALGAEGEDFYFPTALVRYKTPRLYMLPLPGELVAPLHAFLHGRSRRFLERLTGLLLENADIPRFIHHVITEDLKQLEEFYEYGPKRVRRLKRAHGIRRRAIAQDEIDDLLVLGPR